MCFKLGTQFYYIDMLFLSPNKAFTVCCMDYYMLEWAKSGIYYSVNIKIKHYTFHI